MAGCDVRLVIQTLRDYFQPDAVDHVFAQVERFMSYDRTDQPAEKFLMEFGILRQKAEKHMYPAGGGFPDLYKCCLCIRAARLKPNGKTLLMASMGGIVAFGRMTKQLRQLLQAPNAATKEDILQVSETSALLPGEDLSYEARLAYRKGNKQRSGAPSAPRASSKSAGKKPKPQKGEQEKNGFNRRTGERNRRYRCGSEYYPMPKCPKNQENKVPAQLSTPPSAPRSPFSSIT